MTYHSGGHRRVGSTKQVGRREGRGGKDRGRERERENMPWARPQEKGARRLH